MKKVFSVIICALALCVMIPQQAEAAKKKDKKEKKVEWVMPALTGNADVDNYLLKVDTLYNKITSYSKSITFYEMAEIVVKDENGQEEKFYQIVDKDGNLRSSNLAFQQNMDIILAYPNLALDVTNGLLDVTTAEVGALAAVPSLLIDLGPLKAAPYKKYITSGLSTVKTAWDEGKTIYKRARAQAKQIKALKAGKIDDVVALNAEVNAGAVDAGSASMRQVTMSKADYEAQFGKITAEDSANPVNTDQDIPEEEA